MQEDCLVYFFTGFLESGKTMTICSWASSPELKDKKIVIISTEEGEVEYDASMFGENKPVVINCETSEITKEFTFDIEKKYQPDFIFIEWNGSVSPADFFEVVDVPERWALAMGVVVIDASTYTEYYKNMQTIFADYFRYCDTVLFNRVNPEINDLPKLRGSVKSINPACNITFFGFRGDVIDIGDYLPYNLNDNPCVIADDDFGLFYTDALDNVEKYNGKKVSIMGMAVIFKEIRGKAFVLQRRAYTCCANDIGQINVLCYMDYGKNFPVGNYLRVTGTVRYFEDKSGERPVAVPCITVDEYGITSKPENEIIYFS